MKRLATKDINFVAAIQTKKNIESGRTKKMLMIGIPAFAVLVIIELMVMFTIRGTILNDKIDQLKTNKTKIEQSEEYQESIKATTVINVGAVYLNNAQLVDQATATLPVFTSETVTAIQSALPANGEINAITYDAASCYVSIGGTTDSPEKAAQFVRNLRTTGVFSYVSHTGYTNNSGSYAYSISAVMVPSDIMRIAESEENE